MHASFGAVICRDPLRKSILHSNYSSDGQSLVKTYACLSKHPLLLASWLDILQTCLRRYMQKHRTKDKNRTYRKADVLPWDISSMHSKICSSTYRSPGAQSLLDQCSSVLPCDIISMYSDLVAQHIEVRGRKA